jgi:stearoyl-CoA desaturase (delta-9 desaturase)
MSDEVPHNSALESSTFETSPDLLNAGAESGTPKQSDTSPLSHTRRRRHEKEQSSWKVRSFRFAPALVIGVPFIALVLAPFMVIHFGIKTADLLGIILGHFLTIGGITLGYHRALAHKGVDLASHTRRITLILGAMAAQGPPSFWVAHHRAHHGDPDGSNDPHSPWPIGSVEMPTLARFLHSHTGWMLTTGARFDSRLARDVRKDPVALWVDRHYFSIVLVGLLLPALAINLGKLNLSVLFFSIYWTGLVRIAVTHQATWMVNSVCHIWGYRNHSTDDRSRNNWLVALLTLGEGWHNNHHASPRKARHGEKWWEIDPTYLVFRSLTMLKLARYRLD